MPPTSSYLSCQPQEGIHPLLRGLAIEGRAVAVRLLAYVCGLAMLALIAADLVAGVVAEPPSPDLSTKSASYAALRRPDGSRKDTQLAAGDWLTGAAPLRLRGPRGPGDPLNPSLSGALRQSGIAKRQ